ncbi:hypothetical protein V6N12_057432 [Hibiscus sabdariffa]|uniref:C2 domain-containing protein n=1 Tax=Hibiscus sabdariffa TaxID=183260 RepID=A0ABR2C5G8_9ROSI
MFPRITSLNLSLSENLSVSIVVVLPDSCGFERFLGHHPSPPPPSLRRQRMAPAPPTSSGILEITLDSAQDLFSVSKKMKTYAVVWLRHDESNRQATNVDPAGGTNPTWNHTFTFRADEKFLGSAEAAISVEICAAGRDKDETIGYVNVPMKDIIEFPPVVSDATGIFAVQLRRPSGRSQGVLNMEVSLKLMPTDDINGSMVNGSSICNSDIGPSASVVAAAIATGLYKPQFNNQDQSEEATELKEWTKKEREKAAAERRAMGSPPPGSMVLPPDLIMKPDSLKGKKGEAKKVFSFIGFEIAVTCRSRGGGGRSGGDESSKKKKRRKYWKKHGGGGNKVCNLSSEE